MALKRISDLPSLDSQFENANIGDCLFEVSYDTADGHHKYESYYMNGEKVASKIADKISADLDLDKVVYTDNAQNITGKKTFATAPTFEAGIVLKDGTATTNLRRTTEASASIRDAIASQYIVPTTYAVKNYISAQQFLTLADDKWSKTLNMLNSMLSKKNLTMTVDYVNGNDTDERTQDANDNVTPAFKSFQAAVDYAKMNRRFQNGTKCIINLGSNYTFDLSSDHARWKNSVTFEHPDLNSETQYFEIVGNGSNKKIWVDLTNYAGAAYNNPFVTNSYLKLTDLSVISIGSTNDIESHDGLIALPAVNKQIDGVRCNSNGVVLIGHDVAICGFKNGINGQILSKNDDSNSLSVRNCEVGIYASLNASDINRTKIAQTSYCEHLIAVPSSSGSLRFAYSNEISASGCYGIPIRVYGGGQFRYVVSDGNFNAYKKPIRIVFGDQGDKPTKLSSDLDDVGDETKVHKCLMRMVGVDYDVIMTTKTDTNDNPDDFYSSNNLNRSARGPGNFIFQYNQPTEWNKIYSDIFGVSY